MYVVKVGEYYVRYYNHLENEIGLSQEIMRTFPESVAKVIAGKVNGEVFLVTEEVSCE